MSKIKSILLGMLVTAICVFAVITLAAPASAAGLTSSQTNAIIALLQSFGADDATVVSVRSALSGAPMPTPNTPNTPNTLKFGDRGPLVVALQKELLAQGYQIPAGPTGYYGTQTLAAVKAREAHLASQLPPISADLKVSSSQASSVFVQGQALATLGTFTFVNPSSSDVKVTGVGFKRIGVSNDSTLANIYLYNGVKRITDSSGVSNAAFSFNDPSGIFVIPAGGTVSLSVRADIAGSTSGQQVGVQLVSLTSNGNIGNVFPVNSGLNTISAAVLSTVDFGSVLPTTTSVNAQNDYVVWQSNANVGTRAVNLVSFQLKNVGSAEVSDIKNFRLYVDGVLVSSSSMANDIVVFDLSASPKKMETGSRVIKVVADIVGGSGDTFQFSLRRAADIQLIDSDLNQGVIATVNGGSFSIRSATSATISSGSVSLVKAANSPSSDVSINSSSVKLASFELRASGEDVKVESLGVKAVTTGNKGLQNGKVFFNGSQIGSSKALGSTSAAFDLGSSAVLRAGSIASVDVYADTKAVSGTFTNGDVVTISITAGTQNGQGAISSVSLDIPASDVSGASVVLSSSSVNASKASGYGDHVVIPGANGVKIGSFVLSAGSTEGINVNTITLGLSSGEADMITDLRLESDATIGSVKPVVSTSNSFSTNVNIPASGTKTFDVYANVKPTATGSLSIDVSGSGTGASTGNSVSFGSAPLQNITIGSGALIAAVSGSTPNNANALAGTTVKVGSFNFTSQYSSYTVEKVIVKIPVNAATSISSVTLKYPSASGEMSSEQAIAFSSDSYATSTFTGISFNIPANETRKLDVYVKLNSIQQDGDSGKEISVILDADEGFRATDSSGNSITALASDLASSSAGRGSVFVRKATPTLSKVALDTTTLSAGANIALARFKVSTTGDMGWGKITFSLNKSATLTLDDLAIYSGSSLVSGSFATTSDTISFVPTAEEQVGGLATYELRGTVGGISTGYNYVDVSVRNPSTGAAVGALTSLAATPASLVWSDHSSVSSVHSMATGDWTNDYLVGGLPLSLSTLSVNI